MDPSGATVFAIDVTTSSRNQVVFILNLDLMNDKENTECPTDNANKIQELKQVMEFLQHNESYKYSTHRTFDINDPKF